MTVLKVLKEENELMELFIANGLFYILTENRISCNLINKKNMYVIEIYNDINYKENLKFEKIEIDKMNNINSTMNKSELEKIVPKVNEILTNGDYLTRIFKYYESLNEKELTKDLLEKKGAVYIGSFSYTKGVRSYTTAGASAFKVPLYKKILSFLGFVTSTSYFKIKDVIEINPVLIPKNTDVYLPAEFIKYENKETGDTSSLLIMSNKEAKTISLARLYLLSLKMLAKETMLKNYEAVWLMQLVPTKNKPLNDKLIKLPVHNLSWDFIAELLKKVEYTTVDRDAKLSLCDYLLNQDFESFSNMICTFSKSQTVILDRYFEELISLRTNIEKNIYENEDVKILGRGLNRLIRDKDGFSIQIGLLNCLNKQQLIENIRNLNLLYSKRYKTYLLNDQQYINVLNLVEDTKTLKIVRDAILTYSTIYVNSIKNNKHVKILGEGINKSIKEGLDFNIIEKLINCSNQEEFEDIIVTFNYCYEKKYGQSLIDEDDIIDLIKEDKNVLKMVINSILQISIKEINIK